MSALKDQMDFMMEAMLGMKRLMESNAATAATISIAAEVDPILQPTTSPTHHPVPNMRGQGRDIMGCAYSPYSGYNWDAFPYGLPPNFTPPTLHDNLDYASPTAFEGQPPQPIGVTYKGPREHLRGEDNSYPPFIVKGPAPNTLPQPNIAGVSQTRPVQPILLSVERPPPAAARREKLDLFKERLRATEGFGHTKRKRRSWILALAVKGKR